MSKSIEQTIAELVARPFGTLTELIHLQARLRPGHPALIQGDRRISYAELDNLADRVAAALQRDDVRETDVVSICATTSIEYAVVFIGALRAGVAVAPLAPSSTPASLDMMVRDCGAKLFFLDQSVEEALAVLDNPAGLRRIGLDGIAGTIHFDQWLTDAGAIPKPVEIQPEWPFNIIYSSGTTGTPKGIVQSFRMRWRHVNPMVPPGYGPDAVTIISTPLYSNTTLVSFIPNMAGGGTAVLMEKFDAGRFLQLAQQHRATHAMLVPVQYQRLMAHPDFDSFDLSSFLVKFCTSAPFSAELKRDILNRWPGGLVEYFGMTEGGGSCMLEAHAYPDKLHTVGRPMEGHDIRVIDEDGNEVSAGHTGEIVGHSTTIMNGYHNQPEKTNEAIWVAPDGRQFVRTGDIGRFDEEGFLTLMDRKKDMIISGGFNIYPSDLESIIREHPDVSDVAVVGVASEQWGETPVAFIVSSGADADSIKAYANQRLGKTQRLADVILMDELPRSHIGKILKRELRANYTAGIESP